MLNVDSGIGIHGVQLHDVGKFGLESAEHIGPSKEGQSRHSPKIGRVPQTRPDHHVEDEKTAIAFHDVVYRVIEQEAAIL